MTFTTSTPVTTRDGRAAGIYWVGERVIHGWVGSASGGRYVNSWSVQGRFNGLTEHPCDLVRITTEPPKGTQ